jgi:hypothetical protein
MIFIAVNDDVPLGVQELELDHRDSLPMAVPVGILFFFPTILLKHRYHSISFTRAQEPEGIQFELQVEVRKAATGSDSDSPRTVAADPSRDHWHD